MRAIDFEGSTHIHGNNQPQYLPLPTHVKDGIVTSCYELTFKEKLRILFGDKIWVSLKTCGKPLQPQRLTLDKPF